MNERIKELAKKSLPEFYLTNCPSALEKFAELIVQECANEIRKQGDSESFDDWDRGYEAGLISAINAMHKHFGVK